MSDKFTIRPVVDEDIHVLLKWRNHPDVRRFMLTDHEIKPEEHLAWWENTKNNSEKCVLFLLHNEIPVAVFYFYQIKKDSAWWGFYLDNAGLEHSKKKIEVWAEIERIIEEYAKNTLQIKTLFCETMQDNKAVLALHQYAGFIKCIPPTEQLTETPKNVVYMKKELSNSKQPVFFLGSCNFDGLVSVYNRELKAYPNLSQEAKSLPFGQYQALILDENSQLRQQKNGCFVFCERFEDLCPDPFSMNEQQSIERFYSRFNDYLQTIRSARSLLDGTLIINTLESVQMIPEPMIASSTEHVIDEMIKKCNQDIYQLASSMTDTAILPYEKLVKKIGAHEASPGKYWLLGRFPWSNSFSEFVARTLIGQQLSLKGLTARVLVLDLDNTLWGGVIGDDGLEGIQIGGDYPGNVFARLQKLFLAYKQQGILLTLCSKNTDEIAWSVFNEHPQMRLKQHDFVARRINWNHKSENIRELAKELNLGLSAFCFIDDNPVERQEVRMELPEVYVPELPDDQADWVDYILRLPELTSYQLTQADTKRTQQYQQRTQIKQAEQSSNTREEFLKKLEMKVYLQPYQNVNKVRALQLLQKTNQFNTTTRRETEQDIQKLLEDGGEVWVVGLSDKYSAEPENISVIILKPEDDTLAIKSFVMSCRVMGRDLENRLIRWVAEHAVNHAFRFVNGEIIKTQRNQPVLELYKKADFKEIGEGLFRLDLENFSVLKDHDDIFEVKFS